MTGVQTCALPIFADGLEQLEVLHIARADLHDVDILLELGDMDLVHQLTDDGQTGLLAGLDQVEDALGRSEEHTSDRRP